MAAPPVETLEKLGVHGHVGFLCRNPRERLDVLVPFLRIGLARGEKCLLYCAPRRGNEVLAAISAAGVDIGSALARGTIVVSHAGRNATSAFDPDAALALLRRTAQQARSERHSALRICIDIAFVLGKETDSARITAFQTKLHQFLAARDALSLCVHEIDALAPEVLRGALRTHPHVIYDGKVLDNFFFTPPSLDPAEMTSRRRLERDLAQLVERNDRNDRIRRQAMRLRRFRDVTASLLGHEEMSEILNGIAVGVISLGYRMCWIGMAEADGSVVPVAQWGDMNGYLREVAVRWDEAPLGQGPVGRAIREGKPSVVRDVVRSRRFAPWRESALARGILSVAAFPLGAGTPAAGALVVYAPERDAFDEDAVEELSAYAQQATLVAARARELQAVAESGERFRSVVENTDVLVIELDSSGNIVLFNRAAEKITGHDAAEVLGKEYFTLFVPERERERVAADYRNILKGHATEGFTSAIRTKDGGERMLSWNTKAIFGAAGELRGVVGMGLDVTERLRAEKEKDVLRGSPAEARTREAMGALAGAIGHDFNNVLGAIIGYASLMQSRMDPADPLCDLARKIQEHAARAEELTRKLLGFARRKTRRPELGAEPLARGAGTILIVDDERSIREMAQDLLSNLGYDTLLAEDGAVACRIFREREGRIDLVLLDIVMPKTGGKETFEALRALAPSLPILLSSGYTAETVARELLEKGADGFIQKPYSLSELAQAVRRILDARAEQ